MKNVNSISLFELVKCFISVETFGRTKPWLNDMKVFKNSIKIGHVYVKENMHPWYYVDVLDNVIATLKFDLKETEDQYDRCFIKEQLSTCNWLRDICHTRGFLAKGMEYNDPWR